MLSKRLRVALLSAAAIVLPVAARADVGIRESNVPFEFRVGDHVLPAGSYRLKEASTIGGPAYFLMNKKTGKSLMIMRKLGTGDKLELEFAKGEHGYVLKNIQ
jgi:hypothetical protein